LEKKKGRGEQKKITNSPPSSKTEELFEQRKKGLFPGAMKRGEKKAFARNS